MNAFKLLEIMPKYANCPDCGSNKIGNGQGVLIVENNTYTRSCECGFSITLDENENEVETITREKKEKYIIDSYTEFEGLNSSEVKSFSEDVKKWTDEKVDAEYDFCDYLWDK